MESLSFIQWCLDNLNYWTVMLLMTIESSFVPFPSEVVVPPAAYKAYSGEMSVVLVIVFATIGSVLGALINYGLACFLGRPIVYRFANSRWGHLCLLDEEKVKKAEEYFNQHGVVSTFIGRFVPGIRQLISIPAGLARMHMGKFILFTALGAGIWNAILVVMGYSLAKVVPQDQLMVKIALYSHEIGTVIVAALLVVFGYMAYKFLKKKDKGLRHYGLIGYPLSSSFSQRFFNGKFEKENQKAYYDLYPIDDIGKFGDLVKETDFYGMNVTIPYKQQVIPFLDTLDETAKEIGAVNVIKFTRQNRKQTMKGYNTDAVGFEKSLLPLLQPYHRKALVLGTGGASKAVAYVLKKNNIEFKFVSRNKKEGQLTYEELTKEIMAEYLLVINCTPLGMYPVDACPDIPYDDLTDRHLLYDLIYNPEKTVFLQRGEAKGATVKNGLEMLHGQAVAAWEIWNA